MLTGWSYEQSQGYPLFYECCSMNLGSREQLAVYSGAGQGRCFKEGLEGLELGCREQSELICAKRLAAEDCGNTNAKWCKEDFNQRDECVKYLRILNVEHYYTAVQQNTGCKGWGCSFCCKGQTTHNQTKYRNVYMCIAHNIHIWPLATAAVAAGYRICPMVSGYDEQGFYIDILYLVDNFQRRRFDYTR